MRTSALNAKSNSYILQKIVSDTGMTQLTGAENIETLTQVVFPGSLVFAKNTTL